MNHSKRTLFLLLFVAAASQLIGCMSGGQIASIVITPEPVTPITPPDGIRAALHVDPRHYLTRHKNLSEPNIPLSNHTEIGQCFSNDEINHIIEAEATDIETFWAPIYIQTCGWRKTGVSIDVTITHPSGEVTQDTVKTEHMYDHGLTYVSYHLPAEPPELFGTYRITFTDKGAAETGADGEYSAEYEVIYPTEPRIFTLQSGSVWLYGFEPNETVQMLRYDVSDRGFVQWESGGGITETYTLVDQRIVTIEADGTQTLFGFVGRLDGPYGPTSYVAAIGSQSGEVKYPFPLSIEESVLLDP